MRLNSFFYAIIIIIFCVSQNNASQYLTSDKKETALKIQTEIFNDNFEKLPVFPSIFKKDHIEFLA